MAKLTGPLLSLDASGTVAKTITYKKSRADIHARLYRKPRAFPDPKTPKQLFSRDYFTTIVSIWHAADDSLRLFYKKKAAAKNMTGFNLYISDYTLRKPSNVGNFRVGFSHLGVLTK